MNHIPCPVWLVGWIVDWLVFCVQDTFKTPKEGALPDAGKGTRHLSLSAARHSLNAPF